MGLNKEIRALTGIRGIAALYVALFHNLETKNDHSAFGAQVFVYFLGTISYSLYLIHPIFTHYFKAGFHGKYGDSISSVVIFNLIYCTTIILVSYVTYKLIEVPMQKFLNKKPLSKPVLL